MWIVAGVLAVILIVLIVWYISTANAFRRAAVKIQEAASGIDVALTKRHDTLVKLLDIAKGYAKHEKETLLETVRLRSDMTMGERSAASQAMDSAMGRIHVLAEAYPELRSNENFRQLQVAVMDVEEHLQAARRLYNGNVSAYNQMLVLFPKSIVAGMMHLTAKEFFEAEPVKRGDVKMEF